MSAALDIVAPPGIVARLSEFARLLRDNGFTASASETSDAIRYFAETGEGAPPTERRMRSALKSLYCSRASELPRFDELFDAYWNDRVGRKRTVLRETPRGAMAALLEKRGGAAGGGGLADYFEWSKDAPEAKDDSFVDAGGASRLGGASALHASGKTDFGRSMDPEQMAQLLELADRLGARMRFRLARRRKNKARGAQLHLRRTFRRSIATGGVPIRLLRRARREPPARLAMFVDVSGSMDAYSIFFMRFVHALTGRFLSAEAFLFHTRLVHVTGVLREADPIKMMEKMSLISQGWSGGTRIGAAIETFNANYADIYGGSRVIAIIFSDGYDTGGAEQLSAALRSLKQRVHKIFWLNPMLGRDAYAPETAAMAAALPHLDLFAAAHNLDSLLMLEDALVRT
ncbi:MAG: VWA domain-containing protein [Neomegalonema sp.]|nr:VWA domain-containing protein [Neomegalonema sp.]